MSEEFDDATRAVVEKIQKLMRLGASNPNEAEAAAAVSKAQELLAAYNLDASVVEKDAGVSGKRLDENVSGGMYKYQQRLWQHIAELNFCMYWTQRVRSKTGVDAKGRKVRTTFEHRLVGRQVNVIATKNMASYINQTIERLCRERVGDAYGNVNPMASSWMVAFREGITDRVAEKIARRRKKFLREEEEKSVEAARRAAAAGESTSTALTLAGLTEREEIANYDFLHGEGAWAKKLAREAKWEAEWEERRAAQAKAQAEAERVWSEWAAAHPEEAAKEAAAERARERKNARRRGQSAGRWRFRETKEDMRRDSGAYRAGYDAGDKVSIEPQVAKDNRRIGR